MKEIIVKYGLIFLIVIALVIPGGVLLSGFAGCARVSYKDSTPSAKCNFMIMLIKLKSIKGNESFEVGKYLDKCFDDLDKIKEIKKIEND